MLNRFLNTLLFYRHRMGSHTFLIIGSVIIGLVSGTAAVILKSFVRLVHLAVNHLMDIPFLNYLYFIIPLFGILLTLLYLKIVNKRPFEKGLSQVLYAVSQKDAVIEKRSMYSHVITSALTVGFGGSAGLESPIVITGSAIGSNLATLLRFKHKERTILLACGAAAGIASVFNSPIAGVLFSIEVLLSEVSIPVFIPLLISAASASIISQVLFKNELFYFVSSQWYYNALPYYVLLGLLSGMVSVYMTRITLYFEQFFSQWKSVIRKAIFGGLGLGLLIFLLPPLYGEGYLSISSVLHGHYTHLTDHSLLSSMPYKEWILLVFLALIILIKVIATSLTIGAGGNGGIFAPSLFTGGMLGLFVALLISRLGLNDLVVTNFVVVGMAGVLAGVVHAPLTSIFLIAEITGGYVLLVPLMIVTALSYFIVRYFEPYSIYTKSLANKGYFYPQDRDKSILSFIQLKDLIETDFFILHPNDTIDNLKIAFSSSNRNEYPVLTEDGKFIGIVFSSKIKEIIFNETLNKAVKAKDLLYDNNLIISTDNDMHTVMAAFDNSGLKSIPLEDDHHNFLGFVSQTSLFNNYRNILRTNSSLSY